jgi:hypothetical protein
MAVLGKVVEILKRWDRWKRLDETPERICALDKRWLIGQSHGF